MNPFMISVIGESLCNECILDVCRMSEEDVSTENIWEKRGVCMKPSEVVTGVAVHSDIARTKLL